MRQAFSNVGFLSTQFELSHEPVEHPAAISFGYDHCAEHEWGIKQLSTALALPISSNPRALGVSARRITAVSRLLVVEGVTPSIPAKYNEPAIKPMPFLAVALNPVFSELGLPFQADPDPTVPRPRVVLNRKQTAEFARNNGVRLAWLARRPYAAWSSSHALFAVAGEERVQAMRKVLEGLTEEEGLALSQGAPGPFSGSGLFLTRISALSAEQKAHVMESDTEHWALLDHVDRLGVKQELAAAGVHYYALSPRRVTNIEGETVLFYLNPSEQAANHSGWFTVQDLRDWATGKGVIPTRKARSMASPELYNDLDAYANRLRSLYGTLVTPVITWVDEHQTRIGVRVVVNDNGVAAGLPRQVLAQLPELKKLVEQHEARASGERAA